MDVPSRGSLDLDSLIAWEILNPSSGGSEGEETKDGLEDAVATQQRDRVDSGVDTNSAAADSTQLMDGTSSPASAGEPLPHHPVHLVVGDSRISSSERTELINAIDKLFSEDPDAATCLDYSTLLSSTDGSAENIETDTHQAQPIECQYLICVIKSTSEVSNVLGTIQPYHVSKATVLVEFPDRADVATEKGHKTLDTHPLSTHRNEDIAVAESHDIEEDILDTLRFYCDYTRLNQDNNGEMHGVSKDRGEHSRSEKYHRDLDFSETDMELVNTCEVLLDPIVAFKSAISSPANQRKKSLANRSVVRSAVLMLPLLVGFGTYAIYQSQNPVWHLSDSLQWWKDKPTHGNSASKTDVIEQPLLQHTGLSMEYKWRDLYQRNNQEKKKIVSSPYHSKDRAQAPACTCPSISQSIKSEVKENLEAVANNCVKYGLLLKHQISGKAGHMVEYLTNVGQWFLAVFKFLRQNAQDNVRRLSKSLVSMWLKLANTSETAYRRSKNFLARRNQDVKVAIKPAKDHHHTYTWIRRARLWWKGDQAHDENVDEWSETIVEEVGVTDDEDAPAPNSWLKFMHY